MKRANAQPRSFRRGPVLEYWLSRCEGFAVTSPAGRTRGTVAWIGLDGAGRADAIVVRGRLLGRSRTLAPDAVEAVTPSRAVIVLRVARPSTYLSGGGEPREPRSCSPAPRGEAAGAPSPAPGPSPAGARPAFAATALLRRGARTPPPAPP